MEQKITMTNTEGAIDFQIIGNFWKRRDIEKAKSLLDNFCAETEFKTGDEVIIKYPSHSIIKAKTFFRVNHIEDVELYYPYGITPGAGQSGYIYGVFPFGDEPEIYLVRDRSSRVWLCYPDALIKNKSMEGVWE